MSMHENSEIDLSKRRAAKFRIGLPPGASPAIGTWGRSGRGTIRNDKSVSNRQFPDGTSPKGRFG
jgi:hypothetical protein